MAVLLAWLYWYAPRYYYRGRFAPFAAPCLSWLFYLFYLLLKLSKPRNNADFRYSSMIIHNRS